MPDFQLVSPFTLRGDQPQAITELVEGIQSGDKHQVLLGVTGSGKTFTVAKVVETINRPSLVLSHNETLAAQLCMVMVEASSAERPSRIIGDQLPPKRLRRR